MYTGTLNEAQATVLQWIADGCPAGVMHGYEHRISAAALRTSNLVPDRGHGEAWHAELTPTGRAYLESPPRAQPRRRRRRRQPASASDAGAVDSGATSQRPESDKPRRLSPTEQMVTDLLAAGGVIRVPRRHAAGEPDYEQRVASARRFGKVPPGKRLRTSYEQGELEIRLEDAPPGTDVEEHDVPVPARAAKLHPVARWFRDRIEYHEVSRRQLARCARIVDALAREIERRGYTISNVTKTIEGYQGERWSGSRDGHLVVTIRGHARELRMYLDALEEKYGEAPESVEWIAWVRRYVDERLDPLASPPVMSAEPEVRPNDLKPFLGGLSPHGPSGW